MIVVCEDDAQRFKTPDTRFLPVSQKHLKGLHVLPRHQDLRLEAAHLAGGYCLPIFRMTADDLAHSRINRQRFRVVRVFVTRQATVHRLP